MFEPFEKLYEKSIISKQFELYIFKLLEKYMPPLSTNLHLKMHEQGKKARKLAVLYHTTNRYWK